MWYVCRFFWYGFNCGCWGLCGMVGLVVEVYWWVVVYGWYGCMLVWLWCCDWVCIVVGGVGLCVGILCGGDFGLGGLDVFWVVDLVVWVVVGFFELD